MATKYSIPELISHPLCPFTQRCVIVNLKKGLQRCRDFDLTYVDIADLPDWFTTLSPEAGPAFPTLRSADGVMTDAMEIFQYCELLGGESLSPSETSARQLTNNGIAKCDELLNLLRGVFIGTNKPAVDQSLEVVFDFLRSFEDASISTTNVFDVQPIFDAAAAPFFSLAFHFDGLRADPRWLSIPKVFAWGESLMADVDVLASRCPNYDQEFKHFFSVTGGVFPALYA